MDNSNVNISELKIFNRLFSDYQPLFIRFARTYLPDRIVAEDIVIESIVYYWERRHHLAPDSNIPAYILEVVKHKCLNHLRHQHITEDATVYMREHLQQVQALRIASLEACDPQELFTKEAQQLIREALEELPEKTRIIFQMSRYEDKSYKEIAETLHLSVKSVEFHISKALKVLKIKLKDYLWLLTLIS